MARVIIHTKNALDQERWLADTREFTRVPTVGEYLSLNFSGDWYRVILVAHAPFKGDYDAEIYALKGPSRDDTLSAAIVGPQLPPPLSEDIKKDLF